jgi:integrase
MNMSSSSTECKGTRYYALSVFAAAAGCRRGELLALRWPDIDPVSGVVTISKSLSQTRAGLEIKTTKSRRTRFVRVSQTTIQILLEHRGQIEEEKRLFGADYKANDLVFPTRTAITTSRARSSGVSASSWERLGSGRRSTR